jgi:hypothetical protein
MKNGAGGATEGLDGAAEISDAVRAGILWGANPVDLRNAKAVDLRSASEETLQSERPAGSGGAKGQATEDAKRAGSPAVTTSLSGSVTESFVERGRAEHELAERQRGLMWRAGLASFEDRNHALSGEDLAEDREGSAEQRVVLAARGNHSLSAWRAMMVASKRISARPRSVDSMESGSRFARAERGHSGNGDPSSQANEEIRVNSVGEAGRLAGRNRHSAERSRGPAEGREGLAGLVAKVSAAVRGQAEGEGADSGEGSAVR